jgi:ATP-dependent DNA helicase RecG
MTIPDPNALLANLCAEAAETEWLEFKESYFQPDEVGRYVSAVANSAMLADKAHGYLVFGVRDHDHKVVGTAARIKSAKVGAEPLENWLTRSLEPRLNMDFVEFDQSGHHISLLRVEPAYVRPVAFKGQEYIRIGSVTKLLREYPERARSLWAVTSRYSFEQGVALSHVTAESIMEEFKPRSPKMVTRGSAR